MSHGASAWCFAFACATSAAAHGGIPRAITISVAPGNPSHVAVQSDAWGLWISEDGGGTFSWICPEAFEGESLGLNHPSMILTADGHLLVANEMRGLWRSTSDGCGWEVAESVIGETARDLAQAPDGTETFLLTTRIADNMAMNRVWRSGDGGASWTPWGAPLPKSVISSSLDVDFGGRRFHVAAVDGMTGEVLVFVSDDEGTTWRTAPTSLVADGSRPRVTVDPTEPTRLFLRLDRLPASQNDADPSDELYLSTDSGQSFSLVLRGGSDLPGLAFSPDGATVAVAGPEEGLLLADTADLAAGGFEDAFRTVWPGPVWGLSWTSQGLYAGHDDFAEAGPRMWLGVSHDGGQTFSPSMTICDTLPAACADSSPYARTCQDAFTRLGGFRESILRGSRCAAPIPRADAGSGVTPRPAEASSGCGCSVPPSANDSPWALICGAIAAVSLRHWKTRS